MTEQKTQKPDTNQQQNTNISNPGELNQNNPNSTYSVAELDLDFLNKLLEMNDKATAALVAQAEATKNLV